jgi:hypothetical protein
MPSYFISSCTRRQLARRRPRGIQRLQIQLWLVTVLGTAIGIVLTVRGVI